MPLKFEKLHQKAQNAMKENNTYEALQIFRTVRNRCKNEEQALECLDMFYEAAIHFGNINEKTTILDLAEVYAETLIAFNVKPNNDIYDKIANILELLPITVTSTSDPKSIDLRSKYVNDVLKWSRDGSTKTFRKLRGDPELHKRFALFHWKKGSYNIARLHFLLSNDPINFSKFLIEYTTTKHDESIEEGDIQSYILQAVLQLLAYKKLRIAETLFANYCSDHPNIKQKFPFKNDLILNFTWLLFVALEHSDFRTFVYLVEKYQPVLTGDCEYKNALDKVAQVYFKVPPKNNMGFGGFGGMFSGLLKGFMGNHEGAKEEFSPDEEIPKSITISDVLKNADFQELNALADKSNPPGIIKEPALEEEGEDSEETSNEVHESKAIANDNMDLD